MSRYSAQHAYEVLHDQMTAKAEIHQKRREQVNMEAARLRDELTPSLQRAMDLARLKGSSSWLTVLPLEEHGVSLHKGAFVDALALRYGWIPSRLPTCCVCGASFTVEHALSCPRGCPMCPRGCPMCPRGCPMCPRGCPMCQSSYPFDPSQ